MPKPNNNLCSHLHLKLLYISTSNDIKEQNKTQQETFD